MEKRYIERLGLEVSPLGAGVFRFQAGDGAFSDEAFRLMEIAMSLGINYYDTAYLYNSGHSEGFLREALVRKYARDSFIIADKMPVWLCNSRDDMERIFQEQLERLGVEYIDVYLLHSLHKRIWLQAYNIGVLDFLDEKLKSGQIRKAGFSFHDNADKLPMIADAYDWNMAQLQINYYDWQVHDVKQSYEYLESKNIPVVVMQPVGGGRLARMPQKAEDVLRDANPTASIPSWGIRFCASLPNVAVVLSGMCAESELRDNVSCFEPLKPFTPDEYIAASKAVSIFQSVNTISCSACRYCTDGCPMEIDIPYIFQQYNDYKLFDRPIALSWSYLDVVPSERHADKCVNCGQCTDICPQKLDVPAQLTQVHEEALLLPLIPLFKNGVDFKDKLKSIDSNSLVLFGSGNLGQAALKYAKKQGISPAAFCDNNKGLWGTEVNGVTVISPEQLKMRNADGNLNVLITNLYHQDNIRKQLLDLGIVPIN